MIWTLQHLIESATSCSAQINGKWVPARPINGTKEYAPLAQRIKAAWLVFTCKAEAFTWPEGQ